MNKRLKKAIRNGILSLVPLFLAVIIDLIYLALGRADEDTFVNGVTIVYLVLITNLSLAGLKNDTNNS